MTEICTCCLQQISDKAVLHASDRFSPVPFSSSRWIWLVMASGIAIIAAFAKLECAVARRGGMQLIELSLLYGFELMRGLAAFLVFFFADHSFSLFC